MGIKEENKILHRALDMILDYPHERLCNRIGVLHDHKVSDNCLIHAKKYWIDKAHINLKVGKI